jgi:CheY-like chemotaxis protein
MPNAKLSLLIVDDEPAIRVTLGFLLSEIGYKVRTADHGFSALSEIRREVPDILLSDLNMPEMSGFELLSVVRNMFPSIKTIAMSGAFIGDEVPYGVIADAFHQKGRATAQLLKTMEELPRQQRRLSPPGTELEPRLMVQDGFNKPDESNATFACPQCLRTFSHSLSEKVLQMEESVCVYCHSLLNSTGAQPFQERAMSASD